MLHSKIGRSIVRPKALGADDDGSMKPRSHCVRVRQANLADEQEIRMAGKWTKSNWDWCGTY